MTLLRVVDQKGQQQVSGRSKLRNEWIAVRPKRQSTGFIFEMRAGPLVNADLDELTLKKHY